MSILAVKVNTQDTNHTYATAPIFDTEMLLYQQPCGRDLRVFVVILFRVMVMVMCAVTEHLLHRMRKGFVLVLFLNLHFVHLVRLFRQTLYDKRRKVILKQLTLWNDISHLNRECMKPEFTSPYT